jgi:DNA-binding ferritin-like protein
MNGSIHATVHKLITGLYYEARAATDLIQERMNLLKGYQEGQTSNPAQCHRALRAAVSCSQV